MFLPGAVLEPTLRASGDLGEAVRGADVVVSSAPSHAVREVMARAGPALRGGALVVSVSKGLEPERLTTRSEEHTSELQSPYDLVCRLLLEKNKIAVAASCGPACPLLTCSEYASGPDPFTNPRSLSSDTHWRTHGCPTPVARSRPDHFRHPL